MSPILRKESVFLSSLFYVGLCTAPGFHREINPSPLKGFSQYQPVSLSPPCTLSTWLPSPLSRPHPTPHWEPLIDIGLPFLRTLCPYYLSPERWPTLHTPVQALRGSESFVSSISILSLPLLQTVSCLQAVPERTIHG